MTRSLVIAGALILVATLHAGAAAAADLEVSLQWMADGEPTPAAVLVAEPEILGAGPSGALRWELAGSSRTIDLAGDRVWYLWAEAPGYWGEELRIERPRAAGGARLRMFRVGGLEGGLATIEESPGTLEVEFRAGAAAGGEIAGVVDCPVVEGRWRCELPAGRLDLVVRSGLFVAQRISGVSLEAGGRRELGDLELRLGGAVAGRVELEGGVPPSSECRALLEAVETAGGGRAAATLEEAVLAEGWFEIVGAPPGAYRVIVAQPGYLPATSEVVEIAAGVELELPEPLLLSLPARLEIAFEPQLDPYGEPWIFTLTRLGAEAEPRGRTHPKRAGADGQWADETLAPGRFELRLAGRIEPTWFAREIVLEAGGSVVLIEPPMVVVEGWLTLGDEPLAATLVLGGGRDDKSVERLQSDETGYLTGLLPRAGVWKARVEAPKEGLSVQLPPLSVVSDGTGRAAIQIDLPGTRLEGQVNDHLGRPVAGATVRVRGRSSRQVRRIVTDDEGRFLVRGLPPEPVSVRAEAAGARPTAWFEVSLSPGATAEPLQLVLLPRP